MTVLTTASAEASTDATSPARRWIDREWEDRLPGAARGAARVPDRDAAASWRSACIIKASGHSSVSMLNNQHPRSTTAATAQWLISVVCTQFNTAIVQRCTQEEQSGPRTDPFLRTYLNYRRRGGNGTLEKPFIYAPVVKRPASATSHAHPGRRKRRLGIDLPHGAYNKISCWRTTQAKQPSILKIFLDLFTYIQKVSVLIIFTFPRPRNGSDAM